MNAHASQIENAAGYGPHRHWHAHIQLGFSRREDRTVLSDMQFKGPLRVQRPFYPEAETCHSYVLHPPGGMVSGDKIDIAVQTKPGAHALITTPSAGKIYKADSAGLEQQQTLNIEVEDAICEWLPQETIIFDQARANFRASVRVQGDALFTGWEMIALGRTAGNHPFRKGALAQEIEISLDQRCLVWESFRLDEDLSLLTSRVGLNGFTHFGNLYWVGSGVQQHRALLDKLLSTLLSEMEDVPASDLILVATHKPDVLIVRGFSLCAEKLRNAFIQLWAGMRQTLIGKPVCLPRIWST